MQRVNQAYAVLKDPETRQVYDADGVEGVEDYEEQQEAEERQDEEQGNYAGASARFNEYNEDEARRAYEEEFGTDGYQDYHRGNGNIGLRYASEFREDFLADELPRKLTYTIGRFRITFFLTYLIKRELNSTYAAAELLTNWVIILTCK